MRGQGPVVPSAPCAGRGTEARRRTSIRVGLFRTADRAEDGRWIDPTPEPDDQGPGGKIRFGTVAGLIDAQDQLGHAGLPVQREFPGHVVRRPEAHDLQEPSPSRVGAVLEGKIRKDQRAISGDRLGLANHVPFRREPSELASKPLLDTAVVWARRARGKDRIARRELLRRRQGIAFHESVIIVIPTV